MQIKQTKSNKRNSADTQFELFRSELDHLDLPYIHDRIEVQKRNTKTTTGNRVAALQPFVIKYHCTRKPHYDFRLGHLRLLKSWAMKKRPSYDPGHELLAIQVQDHLREHVLFEGVFAEGKAGAGATMVWDMGGWEPLPDYQDIEDSLRKGCLIFQLHGEKTKGKWKLIRHEECKESGLRSAWNLVKELDSFAINEVMDHQIVEVEPLSVLSKRTIHEIKKDWVEGSKKRERGPMLFETED